LVRTTPEPAGRGHYQMHELLRQFAAEKLAMAPADRATTESRHSRYYLALLQSREGALQGKEQSVALDAIAEEIENVRAAWNWAIAQNEVVAVDAALDNLYDFYQILSRYQEGEENFAHAAYHFQHLPLAASSPAATLVLGKLLVRQGALSVELGLYEPARKLLQAGLSLARDLDCREEIAFCLTFLGELTARQGHYQEARNLCQQSLAISSAIDNRVTMARTLLRLVELAAYQGDYAEAKRLVQPTLALSRALDRQDLTAVALDGLGFVTWCLGEYTESEQHYREGLSIAQKIGNQFVMAGALGSLGWLAWIKEGAYGAKVLSPGTEALAYVEKSLALYQTIGHRLQVAMVLGMLGQIANGLGQYELAQRTCQEAIALARKLGEPTFVNYALTNLGYATCRLGDYQTSRQYLLEALRVGLALQLAHTPEALVYYGVLLTSEPVPTPAAQPFARQAQALTLFVVAQHCPQTWQVFKEMAARLQTQLEAELPPEIVAAARAHGEQLTLAEAIAEVLQTAGE
jgi:tetratricopeptide (TPR) repeat protein